MLESWAGINYFRNKNYGEIILSISISFICNNQLVQASLHPATTVLDFLRKHLKLKGTKEACREGDCGACTILVGELNNENVSYRSVNTCLLPLGSINGKHIVTIEGINQKELNVIQSSLLDEGGTQCGFCTPGFIMSITGYFLNSHDYNLNDLVTSLDGNICRCTGYASIKRAAQKITGVMNDSNPVGESRVEYLVKRGILPEYFLHIPDRLKEIAGEKNKPYKEAVNSTNFIAGGTDLFAKDAERLLEVELKFLGRQKEKPLVWNKDNLCFINASATVSDIQNSELLQKIFPGIKNYFNSFGSLPIRNIATIGGNIVNASPIGDSIMFFLALNTRLFLSSENLNREVPLKNFYRGYKNIDKNNEEVLNYISFDIPEENGYFNFEKVSKRTYMDIATVNSAIYAEVKDGVIMHINISAGGVASVPMLLEKTCDYLINKNITAEHIKNAAVISQSEISPIDDVRGSAGYKRLLLRQIIFAHFVKLFPVYVNVKELI